MRTSAMTHVISPWESEFDWHPNARLTSAMEAVPPVLRVQLQLANVLAREGVEQPSRALRAPASDVLGRRQTYTLYGASGTASDQPRHVPVRWQRERLMLANDDQVYGRLAVTPSLRGWLLTATLKREHITAMDPLTTVAARVFELSDAVLGTDIGELTVPDAPTAACGRRGSAR